METIKVIEPRVNVKPDTEKNHVVLMGGLRVNEQVNPADSWGSVGTKPVQALWTINPPSTQTIVDRQMKIRTYFEITTDADLQYGTNDALRQFPISSLCDVLTVQINGESISDNLADKLHAMLCYGNSREDRQNSVSTTPTMSDNYQQYADWNTYGSAKNPLSAFGESTYDPRGGFPIEVIDARTIRVVVTEPILMSPFLSGMSKQDEGFVNVNQLNISYRWKSDLSQILSHASSGNAITTVGVTMYQAPEILTTFITPDLTQPIPQLQVLPYHKSQDYIKAVAPLADGASTRVISDSIKLSQIPRKLYLFCRHQRSTATQDTSDSFLRIDGLSVLWNNQSGLFSSATEQDLFEISKRNGLNLSYPSWRKYRGGVFCLEFGKDIGLLDNEAPGVQGQYTVQIQMDVTNVSGDTFTPEFYQVFLMEGTFSLAENMGRASLGNLTQQAVLASKEAPEMDYHHYQNLQGGSFWSSLKNFVNKVSRGVQKGVGIAEKFAPAVVGAFPELAPIASALPMVGKVAGVARGMTGGRLSGGRLSGGKLSRKTMRRR
jgi:hypothetical protein